MVITHRNVLHFEGAVLGDLSHQRRIRFVPLIGVDQDGYLRPVQLLVIVHAKAAAHLARQLSGQLDSVNVRAAHFDDLVRMNRLPATRALSGYPGSVRPRQNTADFELTIRKDRSLELLTYMVIL